MEDPDPLIERGYIIFHMFDIKRSTAILQLTVKQEKCILVFYRLTAGNSEKIHYGGTT